MPLSTTELPPNYRTVLEVVAGYGGGRHADASEIYARARELRPGIGFATVHRALARLTELGAILKLDVSGSGAALYEPAARPHAHFRCDRCGAVEDVAYVPSAGAMRALEREHGLRITGHAVTLTGTCPACTAAARD